MRLCYHGYMRIFEFFQSVAIFGLSMAFCSSGTVADAAELLMFEQDDCPYCEKFHAEIGPAYPKTEEGKQAPLRVLMLKEPLPDELIDLKPAIVSPTFVLVDDNREIDRLVGYPGDEHFWFLLNEMLGKLEK